MTKTASPAVTAASALAGVTLRAATDADAALLRAIYASTRADELTLVDWTDEQKAAFLETQFEAQRRHYADHYPGASFLVIERDATPIGRLYLHDGDEDVRVMDISLLPEARRQGIGAALLRDVITTASARGQGVSITVEMHNPARCLYERLGFTPVEERGLYVLMACQPASRPDAAARCSA